jgi:signal recognition particle subunit SRP54
MFESLSDKLQRSFKALRGQGTITDENIGEALREIRIALIEADVSLSVVTDLVEHIRLRALGTQVTTALSPSEQIVKIVHDELIALLGKDTARFRTSSQPPSVVLMAGLQGGGKTTTSAKLAAWLKKAGHRPMLVSVDVYRPAARQQLRIVAESIGAQLYEGKLDPEKDGTSAAAQTQAVLRLAKEARREAASFGCDILIVDTAGRNQIDAALMDEMAALKKLLNPSEVLFVADAMTGQDAVASIRHVTGAPIKFLGTGERPDAFEPFHPDRIVSRIMGLGDIATLLERAEEKLDRGKAEKFASKALSGEGFSLDDFRDQLRQIKKMGSMKSILKMLPSVGPFAGMAQAAENVDEKQFNRIETIIDSMTARERRDHEIINGSRRKRIARGSGTTVQEVNNLLRQYAQMRKMFKSMGSGGGIKAQQRMMQQMQPKQRFGR